MSREIETDGFITRQEDLKGSEPKPTWDALSRRLDKLIPPPPFGAVYITEQGLVLMCKGTYKAIVEGKDYASIQDSVDSD